MQEIQPEMQRIQKKYENKKDQASQVKMQQEMMELYKKYNYNPNRVSKIAKPFLASKRAVAVVNNEIEADIKATADTVNVIKNIALNNKNRLKKLYDELLR